MEEIENPGKWNLWSCGPRFDKKREYTGHFTPAGAKVLKLNNEGKRETNGWTFHYQGWNPDNFDKNNYARAGAMKGNLKPVTRRGVLDVDRLKTHGLTKDQVINDPLFFFQLLFSICNPRESEIEGDQRMPYFTHVTMCTNGYSGYDGRGSDSGHMFHRVTEAEMVHWRAVPIHHGALEGKPGSIYKRWDSKDRRYDGFIDGSINKTWWKNIKWYFKLNNNMMAETDKSREGYYDPFAKYDHIFKCLVHNINYLTLQADLDCCVDETTWGFGGWVQWRMWTKTH